MSQTASARTATPPDQGRGRASRRGRLSRLGRGLFRQIAFTHAGRFTALALALASAVAFGAREAAMEWFAWALIPAAAWLAFALYRATASPLGIFKRWRLTAGLLAASLSAIGLLGMIDPPLGSDLSASLGGLAGAAIARQPLNWSVLGPTPFELAVAIARVGVIALAGAFIVWPRRSASMAGSLGRAGGYGAKVGAAGFLGAWSWFRQVLAERAERRRAEREARAAARAEHRRQQEAVAAAAAELEAEAEARRSRSAALLDIEEPPPPVPEAAEAPPGRDASAAAILPPGAPPLASPAFRWTLPPLTLLATAPAGGISQAEISATSELIVDTLAQHGIEVSIGQVRTGPTVTMYGIVPGWGGRHKVGRQQGLDLPEQSGTGKRVRVDTILAREKDLALALATPSLRFEAPVPGESVVGIEVPNSRPSSVTLRSVMETREMAEFGSDAALPVALGVATGGDPLFTDLTRMPHLLIAGATGSGKSVCMNAIITGLLMARSPAEMRLVLVDPKRVELTPYADVPHLSTPPVVEADRAVAVLKAVVKEMMDRFRVLEAAGAKNIASYNDKAATRMPYLVVAVDELADLMLSAANDVERLLCRLAQLGRATGIHLVVATQRPSVDVVTGLIKANFPSRISFSVTSQVDSRTIIDSPGADKLLGKGDMLFLPIDRAKPMRVQGAFLSDSEVEAIVDFWRKNGGPPMPQLIVDLNEDEDDGVPTSSSGGDSLFDRAVDLASSQSRLSTSLLQRRLRIGYPRAARLMDELEEAGVVGPGEPGKPRVVIGH